MSMKDTFLHPFNPTLVEGRIYEVWEQSGFFNPDVCIRENITSMNAPYFSIVLPPPNVTGTLHMGSVFMLAIEDIMVRYNRMLGKRTLWIPGTDHAAIATQSKVEKLILKEEGKNRHDLGRTEFLKRVELFAAESHDTIISQTKKMGCSLDWSREAFTLDEKRNFAVKTVFKKMYDDGIIYRGFRIINWDPKGQTTISDDEIVYKEQKAILFTFKYSAEFPIAISTTRPETKVGDTAVAVHPTDTRYLEFVGKTYDVDFMGEKLSIKIVADESVDPEFGTGALGVTPAHSHIDWDIAKRHGLEIKPVINEYAKMIVSSPLLHNKKTTEAREIVAQWLRSEKLMIEEKEVSQNISTAERTEGIIEPLPKLQWFIDVNKEFPFEHDTLSHVKKGDMVTLKKLMLSVVENNNIDILPDRFEKVYTNWITNLRDWCISRQIWYGHRIPVWYKGSGQDQEMYCGIDAPTSELGDGWEQDSDTLDTWFSSGLWTFSTLGWPEVTHDLQNYHPITVLETGYDILFFWVARMILMSTYVIGQIPFEHVYLHGLVRNKDGNKISKSLGNNIDPVEMIAKYGADAIRMGLLVGTGPGNDSKISDEKFKAYKLFSNKIWNITRYVLTSTENWDGIRPEVIIEADMVHINDLNALVADITSDMDSYRLYLAAEKLYHYIWHQFADIIIEESKENLKSTDSSVVDSSMFTLRHILDTSLKLLHPFMPFITEEIWSHLPETPETHNANRKLLMVTGWPK